MNKLWITFLILFTAIFSEVYSEIISGTDRLLYNENVTFIPHSITKNTWNSTMHEEGSYNVYKCTADVDSIDIFNAVQMVGTCTFTCHILAIGSPRPFFLSKIPFESFDFSDELNIYDTLKFMKIDTLINNPMVSNSLKCLLPHVILRSIGYLGAKKYESVDFGIFKNIEGKYFIAKFDTIMNLSSDGAPEPQMHPYLKGYNIKWYLQNDGSLQFDNITSILPIVKKEYKAKKIKDDVKTYYDIYGRKISNVNNCVPQLIIRKNAKSISLEHHIINVIK
jgi:hypothetical protein